MYVVYDELVIVESLLHGNNVPSTLCIRFCQPTTHDIQMPLYHASVLVHLSHVILQKCSKMQHIFAYNGFPVKLPPRDLHF